MSDNLVFFLVSIDQPSFNIHIRLR